MRMVLRLVVSRSRVESQFLNAILAESSSNKESGETTTMARKVSKAGLSLLFSTTRPSGSKRALPLAQSSN